jgi:hypothetical protein
MKKSLMVATSFGLLFVSTLVSCAGDEIKAEEAFSAPEMSYITVVPTGSAEVIVPVYILEYAASEDTKAIFHADFKSSIDIKNVGVTKGLVGKTVTAVNFVDAHHITVTLKGDCATEAAKYKQGQGFITFSPETYTTTVSRLDGAILYCRFNTGDSLTVVARDYTNQETL